MQKVILEYVGARGGSKGQRVGVMVATVVDGDIRIGWAKANLKAGDRFDKQKGIDIALDRANGRVVAPELPECMRTQMRGFQIRALRYFQQGLFSIKPEKKVVVNPVAPEIFVFDVDF